MATYTIRTYGDPVLRERAPEVDEVDGALHRLAEDMVETMRAAPGVGLAAPQVGVRKRMFVYDVGDGPQTIVNPEIVESRGEFTYEEGCLSVPRLAWPIVRPDEVHLRGYDLDGNEIDIEASEYLGRVFQHELDHLDGVLLIQHLDPDQRKEAKRILSARALGYDEVPQSRARPARVRSRAVERSRARIKRTAALARVVFLGTPEVAVGPLRALSEAGHEVILVVSAPDRRRGRGGALLPSPVKAAALALGFPVTDRIDDVLGAGADLGVVVAYGWLIKQPVLGSLPLLNIHFSLLPRWRGAAPVERAILAGDATTGVCLMRLEAGLDTGPVYARAETGIGDGETAAELSERLAQLGSELLVSRLADWPSSLGPAVEQSGDATYAAKLTPAERMIDWSLAAVVLERVVRIGHAATTWRGQRLVVHRARPATLEPPGLAARSPDPVGTLAGSAVVTGDGLLELIEVQGEGRARQPFAAWANGARPVAGERFAS